MWPLLCLLGQPLPGPLVPPPAAMYVFIKFTRLAGYRAAAPQPVPTAVPPLQAAGLGAGEELAMPDGLTEYQRHYEL